MKAFDRIDTCSTDIIRATQDKLLAEAISYALNYSPYYRKKIGDLGLSPTDITGTGSIEKLPLTDRKDLQEDTWAFLSVDRREIAEIVSTSGTSGEPAYIAMTRNDLTRLACNEARNFESAGAIKGDIFQLAVTCDNLFIAGIAYYSGLAKLGASVVRIGPQNIIRHLDFAKRLRPAGIVAVPSFMVHMARRMSDNGIDAEELGFKKIVLIGDSIRDFDLNNNALGNLIESAFGNKGYSTYGITEAQLSFFECSRHQGLHSHPDLVLAEIVDDDGNVLSDGEVGELVLTPLQLEGMPLLRYKTGDITFRISEPCACGRNSVRIGPILGRRCQRLKYKGVTLYPKTIENALLGVKDVVNYQIEAFTGDDLTDNIIVRIGSNSIGHGLKTALHDALLAKARVKPRIEIELPEAVEKRLFEGGSRKAVTFRDRRVNAYG